MAWYKSWFGDEYLDAYPHRDQEEALAQVRFILDVLKPQPATKILDIACGSGRHLRSLADEGFRAYGIDYSDTLLSKLKENLAAEMQLAIRADMRALPFADQSFDLALNMFTGFGYFETDAEHQALLEEWRRILKPSGTLFLDYLNRDHVIANLNVKSAQEARNPSINTEKALSSDGKRVVKKIQFARENQRVMEFHESVRMYSLEELQELLTNANFTSQQIFGNFDGSSFSPTSPRLIICAQAT